MIYKSLREEWPYSNEEVWLRWTTDGVNYREEIIHEKKIDQIECLDIPHWRPIDPPEWMSPAQQDQFIASKKSYREKIDEANQV